MNRRAPLHLLSLLCLSLLAVACAEEQPSGLYQGTLVLEGTHAVPSGDTLPGFLVVLDGEVTLPESSQLTGSIYMIGGQVYLAGHVAGDVNLLGGDLNLAPIAQVDGRLNVGGGTVTGAEAAAISGGVRQGTGIEIPLEWTQQQRSPLDVLLQSFFGGLFLGILAALSAQFLPRPAHRVARAALRHPLVAVSLGALALVVGIALLVIMAFTIILLPLSLLGILVGMLVLALGWIALGTALGRWLGARLPWSLSPPAAAFLGTLLFMLLTGLLGLLPVVGGLLSLLLAVTGGGAVLLTRFGTRTFVPASDTLPEEAFLPPPPDNSPTSPT